MDHPHTDIICLVHNSLHVTRGFVKCLFEHTKNFNLIFVDNASTDDTPPFLAEGEQQGKWKVVKSNINLGVIGGRNLGAQHIEAGFFINLDNDQYVQKGWLDSLFALINKGFDLVGAEAWALLPPKTPGAYVHSGIVVPDRSYFPYKRCTRPKDKFSYVGGGGTLIKTVVYKDIGLFDERFSPAYFEDPDLSFRAIQAGYKIGWVPHCPINHLAHQTFNSQKLFNKSEQFIKSWKQFRDKWFPYFPSPICMDNMT